MKTLFYSLLSYFFFANIIYGQPCPNTQYTLESGGYLIMTGPELLSNYQWYTNTNGSFSPIPNANERNFVTYNAGDYYYTAVDGQGCPVSMVCPISIIPNQPLPVKFIDLFANAIDNEVIVEWKTIDEINCDKFVIFKSSNSYDWISIGTVNAHNTLDYNVYNFRDSNPNNGLNYYKIAQYDFNGKVFYSEIEKLRFMSNFFVEAWPNPFNDFINVNSQTESEVTIYNQIGTPIDFYENLLGSKQIDFRDVPEGIYWVHFKNDALSKTIKIVKHN